MELFIAISDNASQIVGLVVLCFIGAILLDKAINR